MSDCVELTAPAKVNLALLVGPRRSDGYHEVCSLMLPVTLADRVVVQRGSTGVTVDCEVAPGEDNLTVRAVRALETAVRRPLPVHITVHKRIPHGAGLGGGSSDAAATLRAVQRLYDLHMSERDLYRSAAAVGADVPFFLWPGAQVAMGRGTVLRAVTLPGPLHLVLAVPDLELPTVQVYGWRDADVSVTVSEFAARAAALRHDLAGLRRTTDVSGLVQNDLEVHVVARHQEVGVVRQDLIDLGAVAAAMSGSGSSVFGLFEEAEAADSAAARLRGTPGLRVFCVSDLQLQEPGGHSAAAAPGR